MKKDIQTSSRLLRTKLNPLYAAMLPLMVLGMSTSTSVQAVDETYNVNGGNWSTGSNWADSSAPVSDNALRLIFNRGTTTSSTHDLGNLTLNRFSPSTPFTGSTILTIDGAAGTDILTFDGTTPQIDITSAAVDSFTIRFNVPVVLNQTLTVQGTINKDGMVEFNGNVSGTGGLTVTNDAEVRFQGGGKTYSGTTTIDAGTRLLNIDDNNSLSANSAHVINGTLFMRRQSSIGSLSGSGTISSDSSSSKITIGALNTSTSFSGRITGSGSFAKTGTGTLTLTGNNTRSGGITISDGTLQVGDGGTTGSIRGNTTNNSALIFNRSDASSYSGAISGTGTVTKQGAGTLTLTGNNTYSGITTISAGTLQIGNGGTSGTLGTNKTTNNSALIFNRSDATTYAGNIEGSGTVTKQGTGTLTLTGTNTYTGATTVNAGTLSVNGSIDDSTTTVNSGGTLGGTGTVGTVNINGGTFAPGNSIGTINTGDIDFSGGGQYDVEVNAAGATDLINVTGTATLTSGVVNVKPEAGNYAISTDYTILTATNPLVGTFASVNSNLAFLTPTLSYGTNDVFLKLTRNNVSFSSVANTPNQKTVSTVLTANSTALQSIYNNVLTLTNSSAQQAFDSLSGVQHTQSQVVINKLTQQFQQLLFNHSSQSANGSLAFNSFNPMQGHLVADNTNNWQTADIDTSSLVSQRGWWTQGFGSFGSIDDTTNASGADYQSGGVAFGVDTDWRDFIVGVAGSYTRSNVDPFAGDSDINSFQAGAYGSWERNNLYMNASVGLGLHKVDATRSVTVGTSVNTASSDYDSVMVSSAIEVGKDIKLNLDTTLTPYVGINYSHNNRDSFTETGAGAANLTVNEQDEDSLRTTVGLRLSRDIKTKNNNTLTPSAMIAYVREHLDNVSRLEAGFSSVPTSTFRIDGSDLDRDRLQVGLGLTGQLNENTTLNVGYNGELSGSDDHHAFAATVKFVW